jgi:hypothetical protein
MARVTDRCRLAFAPAAYTFVSRTTMNLQDKDSSFGAALGGFAAGGVLGLPCEFYSTTVHRP